MAACWCLRKWERNRGRSKALVFVVAFCALLGAQAVNAVVARADTKSPPKIKVVLVDGKLALKSRITVGVRDLQKYLKLPGKDPNKFVLYLDGRRIDGIYSQVIPGKDKLRFDVRRTDASTDAWNALLGAPRGLVRRISVSVGYDKEEPIETTVDRYPLSIVNSLSSLYVFAVVFLLVLVGFVWAILRTPIIRDPSDLPPNERPYSLGRTQMAVWSLIVLGSFIFIYLITGEVRSLTESALTLIGISAATALGARLVDVRKDDRAVQTDPDLPTKRKQLKNAVLVKEVLARELKEAGEQAVAGETDPETIKASAERRKQLASQVQEQEKKYADEVADAGYRSSRNFFDDILADRDGYSLHRCQMAVWTVVLGIIFIRTMYQTLAMPEFGGTLLALMGISGGTYIGFKFPEK